MKRVYLAQTDTTAGFLSQDAARLAAIKGRDPKKPFLREADSLATLKNFARIPKKYKKRVRRARRTTFVYPNGEALRVVFDEAHLRFLRRFGWMYSTSANRSGEEFDLEFAKEAADVVAEDERGLFAGKPSKIVRLNKGKIKKVR